MGDNITVGDFGENEYVNNFDRIQERHLQLSLKHLHQLLPVKILSVMSAMSIDGTSIVTKVVDITD